MAPTPRSRPGRHLLSLGLIGVLLFGGLGAAVAFSNGAWTPKLALDLEGGREFILTPVPQPGTSGTVDANTIQQAVQIIRQRVNGSGISEAQVSTQGAQNIIVDLPGNPDERTRELVRQSAQLEFRAVLVAAAGTPAPTSTPTITGAPSSGSTASPSAGTASPSATGSASPSASIGKPQASPASSASPSSSSNGMVLPRALRAAGSASSSPSPAATGSPSATSPSATSPSGAATPSPSPSNASDLAWVTPALYAKFQALNCANPSAVQGGLVNDPAKPLVTCSTDGAAKYILGPVEVTGKDISGASADLQTNSQGSTTGAWEVRLNFTSAGAKKFAAVTTRLAAIPQTDARNQFGIVLDGLVISAPQTNSAITGGTASITGNFTQASATDLANKLKFGALPISFRVETEQQISALLGAEQLQRGILAGLIGLLLVVGYSLLQYRALGLVTVGSLVVAGGVTYGLVTFLSWSQGYRLSLPGVAGLIVSIGITADSFIVFFERVRDEVRDGRGLAAAVEAAWVRARRTILVSDLVSLLAAVVLYFLAVGGVRGFAFTLGLTTVVDVLVVFLFTKPVVTLLARTRFFGGGHKLSGFDPEHLGRSVAYAGRGRVRGSAGGAPPQRAGTIAGRRAAAAGIGPSQGKDA